MLALSVLVLMSVLVILMVVMMFILVMMMVLVLMSLIFVRMRVSVVTAMSMHVLVAMLMREMNLELHSLDGGFVSAGNVQMVPVEFKFLQFVLQVMRVHTQIEQRANKHVTTDPAE